MRPSKRKEYPKDLQEKFKKAKKLEWLTIAYLISTAIAVYLTMGNSQAMKTAWFEDILSLTPAVSFLIASKVFRKPSNKDFPYGFHKVESIAYLVSAFSLFAVGSFLLVDSILKLVHMEHPTIGSIVIFEQSIWLGYLMIPALLWGTIPAIFLGRIKLPLAEKLHDKNLFTDAKMNKADWMTALAAILGVIGIGFGLWWADSLAAAIISADIIHDGYVNLKQAIFDLMNHTPHTVNERETTPLLDEIREILKKKEWIKDFQIRLREEGHIYFGEGFIIPEPEVDIVEESKKTMKDIYGLSWRINEFHLIPVDNLSEDNERLI